MNRINIELDLECSLDNIQAAMAFEWAALERSAGYSIAGMFWGFVDIPGSWPDRYRYTASSTCLTLVASPLTLNGFCMNWIPCSRIP